MELAFPHLTAKQQRGSKPRCHLLTHGQQSQVAARLTALIQPWGKVRQTDRWMPYGFKKCREAQLHAAEDLLPHAKDRLAFQDWWLAVASATTTTPNIDLASTCEVMGKEGLLLVEAKAHDFELSGEEGGKKLKKVATQGSLANHEQIGEAIQSANTSLARQTGLAWSLSRDARYQMSNRFAWAWKVTDIGLPVILVYLGFTGCEEMRDGETRHPLEDASHWERLVLAHSAPLFPAEVWNREWQVNGRSFIPLVRTADQSLDLC